MLGFFPSGATAGLIKLPVLLQSQTKISYNNTTSYFKIVVFFNENFKDLCSYSDKLHLLLSDNLLSL